MLKINQFDRVSTSEKFNKLHWLKIKERIVFKILLNVQKCVKDIAPKELTEMFYFVRSDRTRKLLIKSCNGQMGDRTITVCGPKFGMH